jgi:Ni/Co efflux regulator RcnB
LEANMKTQRLTAIFAGLCLMASAGAMASPGDRGDHPHPSRTEQVHREMRHDTRHISPVHAGHPGHARPDHRHYQARVTPHRWQRGDRLPASYRSSRHVVKDWHRHGLRRPVRGHEWISVGRDYLLIATATGLIAQAVLSR